MIFIFFGHPGSRFSIRGLSKACDFYVFRASRVSIKHPRLSGTLVFFMFFGHPGSRFSIRGLSKARDFYVFRASRIPIQYSRFEQSLWVLCFSGIQDPDSVFAVWAKLVSSRVKGLWFVVVRIWIKSKKNTKWNRPKTLAKQAKNNGFRTWKRKIKVVVDCWRNRVAGARQVPPEGGGGLLYGRRASRAEGLCWFLAETPKNRVFRN